MKLLLLLGAVSLLLTPTETPKPENREEDYREEIAALVEEVDLSAWDSYFLEKRQELGNVFTTIPSDFVLRLSQGDAEDAGLLTEVVKSGLTSALPGAAALFTLCLGLGVLFTAVKGISPGEGEAAALIFRAVAGCLLLSVLYSSIMAGKNGLKDVEALAEISMPLLSAILILFGMTASSAALGTLSTLLNRIILSLLTAGVVPLALIGGVSTAMDLRGGGLGSSIGKLSNTACKWAVSLSSALYLLITTISGSTALTADNLLLKTGKLAAGSLPVVGSLLSDSLEAAYGCLSLVKNAVGITGILLCLLLLLKPVLRLLLNAAALKAAAAFLDPVQGKTLSALFRGLGDMLVLIAAALCASGVMLSSAMGNVMGCLKGG